MSATLSMSLMERERASIVRQVADGQFSQAVGAARLEIGARQMKRLMRAWRAEGDAALVSRPPGRSPRPLPAAFVGGLRPDCTQGPLWGSAGLFWAVRVVGGIVLLLVDRLPLKPRYTDIYTYPWHLSLILGLFQMLALIPGVSRPGAPCSLHSPPTRRSSDLGRLSRLPAPRAGPPRAEGRAHLHHLVEAVSREKRLIDLLRRRGDVRRLMDDGSVERQACGGLRFRSRRMGKAGEVGRAHD